MSHQSICAFLSASLLGTWLTTFGAGFLLSYGAPIAVTLPVCAVSYALLLSTILLIGLFREAEK